MGILSLFKRNKNTTTPRGFYQLTVKQKVPLTENSVKLIFNVPEELKSDFSFTSGQYVNLAFKIKGHDIRRSYSICSGVDEDLAIGVKRVHSGEFSVFILDELKEGDPIMVSKPMGNFLWNSEAKSIVAFTAGSGITPVLAMAKSAQKNHQQMHIFYGNKMVETSMFMQELQELSEVKVTNFYSQQSVEGAFHGRMTKENLLKMIKEDLSILTADDFYLCGPEDMILNAQEVLSSFGVSHEKIHFELFRGYKSLPAGSNNKKNKYVGSVKTTVVLDGETYEFEMNSKENVLQKALDQGIDAPYSCRGGVCQTCRCKIVEGSADMKMNFALSKKDIQDGYILSCQAHPTSEKLKVTYDE